MSSSKEPATLGVPRFIIIAEAEDGISEKWFADEKEFNQFVKKKKRDGHEGPWTKRLFQLVP